MSPEDADLLETVKRAAVELKRADIPFALCGGWAVYARGGPRSEHDADFALAEQDVPRALDVLQAAGFEDGDAPEDWLAKVWDRGNLVDLIFRLAGEPVTPDTFARVEQLEVGSVQMPVLSRHRPGGDQAADLPRPLLRLRHLAADGAGAARAGGLAGRPAADGALAVRGGVRVPGRPAGADRREAGGRAGRRVLPAGPDRTPAGRGPADTAELGVRVAVHGDGVFLSGDVASEQRRRQVVAAATEEAGGLAVHDDLAVTASEPPTSVEELR